MSQRYGVVSVTAVGMFGPAPMWVIPLSAATVAVAVGSIVERPVLVDGHLEAHEHLCLTLSLRAPFVPRVSPPQAPHLLTALEELVERAPRLDTAVLEDDHLVGAAQRHTAVRHHEARGHVARGGT